MTQTEFQNTLYTHDNLFVLCGMNSASVDLIYLDPPFNSKRMYSAPMGSKAAGASFKDMWTFEDVNQYYLDALADKYPALAADIDAVGALHSKAMESYLVYMVQRIIEMHRVLKPTGSFYLHCDPTASHYLKRLLDGIFGKNNFRNEIIWCYKTRQNATKRFNRKHDVILYYTKSDSYTFNDLEVRENLSESTVSKYRLLDEDGRRYRLCGRGITGSPIRSAKDVDTAWERTHPELTVRVYLDERLGMTMPDYWDIDIINQQAKERTGYPTQKPLALLHRIIKASSNKGDIVFDPFCGCATACVAAQQLSRRWVGIDIAEQSAKILVDRLSDATGLFDEFVNTTLIPQRTDVENVKPSVTVKQRMFAEQAGKCNVCCEVFKIYNLEIDHIIPRSKGGGDYYENYQLLCGNCNRMKGNRPMDAVRMKVAVRNQMMKKKVIFGD